MLGRSHTRFPAVKLALSVVALALWAPVLARADSLTFSNSDGTVKLVGASFTLTNSGISELNGMPVTGYSLSFATSTSFSGSLGLGGSWAAGGSLTIKEAGVGVVFSGTFSGPVTWTLTSASNCTSCQYVLSGGLSGMFYPSGEGNGSGVSIIAGSTTQIGLTTHGTGLYTGKNGSLVDMGGTTSLVTPIPEPGSLGLMGTGLLGVVAVVKRKLKSLGSLGRTDT